MGERCKKEIFSGAWSRSRQCTRDAVKDGFCRQHHPDMVKARQEKSSREFREKLDREASIRERKVQCITLCEGMTWDEGVTLRECRDRLQLVTDTLAYLQGEDWDTIKNARALLSRIRPIPAEGE